MIDKTSTSEHIEIEWPPAADALIRRGLPPRDLRWLIGGVARILISLGLLIFALVGYQLWGTRIQEARAQGSLGRTFSKLLASSPAANPPVATSIGSTTISSTVASATATLTSASAAPATTEAPAVAVSTTNASDAVVPDVATNVKEGDPIANLQIPKIGVDKIVVSGVSTDDLRRAPGHFPDTAMPGQLGNAAIAGHRTTFGAPFYRIDELDAGDPIIVTTIAGRFTYKVTGTQIVDPGDFEVLAPTDDAVLTLISCHPRLSAAKRIVVRATLDRATSAPPALATTPSQTAVSSSSSTTATSLAAVGTEGETGAGSTAGTTVPAGDAVNEGATGAGPNSAAAVALRQGWFSDTIAWADVATWGGVLAGISLLAWRLSLRTRNLVGGLIGFLPFVLALYFFFENFSRLLPPNL